MARVTTQLPLPTTVNTWRQPSAVSVVPTASAIFTRGMVGTTGKT
jgi:hypothetical protein